MPFRTHARPDFFQAIDTEEQAYWLGFFSADGQIHGNNVALNLQSLDACHVREFRNMLCPSALVREKHYWKDGKRYSSHYVDIWCPQIVRDLATHGVRQDKEQHLSPWNGSPELMRHYWRGFCDGDGWICSGKHNCLGVVGTKAMVQGFIDHCRTFADTAVSVRPKGSVWVTEVGGFVAQTIARHLYEGATVSLDRKQESAGALCLMPLMRKRKKELPALSSSQLLEAVAIHGTWAAVAAHFGVKQDAIITLVQRHNIQGKSRQLIEHNGEFRTCAGWAKKLGIRHSALSFRLENWPKDEALSRPTRIRQQKLSALWLIEYNGVKQSVAAWAKSLNINLMTLRSRLDRWSVEDALTRPLRKRRLAGSRPRL
jgi:hypothetical protein